MAELGTIIKGREIGKSPKHRYIWVSCPLKTEKDCLGERWAIYRQTSGQAKIRLCVYCNRARQRHFVTKVVQGVR